MAAPSPLAVAPLSGAGRAWRRTCSAPGQKSKQREQCSRTFRLRAGALVLHGGGGSPGKEEAALPAAAAARLLGNSGDKVTTLVGLWVWKRESRRWAGWAYGLGQENGPQAHPVPKARTARRWRAGHLEILLALAPESNRLNSTDTHRLACCLSPLLPLAGETNNPHLHLSASLSTAPALSPAVQRQRPMDQFHDRQHVWLRSRVRGTYLHADHDGVRVSLSGRRASMKAAWTVHLYRDDDDVQYVLLYSAAYGRYLAATDDPVPLGLCGFHVEQRNYGPPEVAGIRWQAGPILWDLASGDIQLRHVGRYGNRFLRANGKYLRWINRVTVDEAKNITDMMRWVVEPIPARLGRPDLPRPTRV